MPYRNVSKRYGMSTASLSRHLREHLPELLRRAKEAEEWADGEVAIDVVRQLKAINAAALGVLSRARNRDEPRLELQAIDRVHKQLELQAKLLGDLDDRPQVNLYLSPEWIELRGLIVAALQPHTEARESVLRAIGRAEAGGTEAPKRLHVAPEWP